MNIVRIWSEYSLNRVRVEPSVRIIQVDLGLNFWKTRNVWISEKFCNHIFQCQKLTQKTKFLFLLRQKFCPPNFWKNAKLNSKFLSGIFAWKMGNFKKIIFSSKVEFNSAIFRKLGWQKNENFVFWVRFWHWKMWIQNFSETRTFRIF